MWLSVLYAWAHGGAKWVKRRGGLRQKYIQPAVALDGVAFEEEDESELRGGGDVRTAALVVL